MDMTVLHRMFTSNCINRVVFVAMITLCLLSGCANTAPTPFQPTGPSQPFGYSSQQMNESTFRILFAANEHTDFTHIESFAHKRAAIIAKQQGFAWYRVVSSTADSLPARQATAPVPPQDISMVEQEVTEKLPEQPCDDRACMASKKKKMNESPDEDSNNLPTRFYTLVIQGGVGQAAPNSAVWVAE